MDESTGRVREKSRWSESLHQAVEAKELVYQEKGVVREGVDPNTPIEVMPEEDTLASITFQVFFRYYKKLAGMSVSCLLF